MNFLRRLTIREKIFLFIIIILASVLGADWNSTLAAAPSKEKIIKLDNDLYRLAKIYGEKGDLAQGAALLYAYIQRNPDKYANNIGGRADDVDEVYRNWIRENQEMVDGYIENYNVIQEYKKCGKYPCSSGNAGVITLKSEGFPPDLIKVCEHKSFEGTCSYLKVGEYTRWQDLGVRNDSMSSVEVGSNVQVMLCTHHLQLPSDCITLTNSDSNLSDNRPPANNYNMNDNVSTAKVTFKSGKGYNLP